MIKIVLGRLLQLIVVFWIILIVISFTSKLVSGDPFSTEHQVTPQMIAKLNKYYGLDIRSDSNTR